MVSQIVSDNKYDCSPSQGLTRPSEFFAHAHVKNFHANYYTLNTSPIINAHELSPSRRLDGMTVLFTHKHCHLLLNSRHGNIRLNNTL